MQTVVLSILLLGCLSAFLKLSFARPWHLWLWTAAASVGTGLAGHWASTQSKTQIADFLSNPTLMADVAVLLTLEVSLMVAFCLKRIQSTTDRRESGGRETVKRVAMFFVEMYPGIILFVAIFCMLTALMFQLTGVSFSRISWMSGAALAAIIPILAWSMRRLFSKPEQRLELLFFINLTIAALGIVSTVNGRTAVESAAHVDWTNLLAIVVLTIAMAAIGWGIRYVRKNCKNKY